MNITAALLSIILAFLLLAPILMLGYFVLTSIFTAIFFTLRTRLHTRPRPKAPEINLETKEETHNQRLLLLIFLVTIVMLASPLLLAKALDPYVWFILMLSLIAGFSIAEILFYLHTR